MLLAAGWVLAACQPEPAPDNSGPRPSPLLFAITNDGGESEGWLFGTIHALPDGIAWRTQALENAEDDADLLIVEIADLGNRNTVSRIYTELASTRGLPPLTQRISPDKRAQLDMLIVQSDFEVSDFDAVETWAAALMLAQLAKSGKASNGADRAIIREFETREIMELEGARAQLSIFDALPEADQRGLLEGVIADIDKAKREPTALRDAWLSGDEAALIEATQTGILADPELREALLVKRNRDWIAQLEPILKTDREPLVAVGAGHLVGEDGLPALLRARGYVVTRLQ